MSDVIELYRWQIGTEVIGETSAYSAQTHAGVTYRPVPIARSEIGRTASLDAEALTLTVPASHEIATRCRVTPPDGIDLTLLRRSGSSTLTIWEGRLVAAEIGRLTATLTCDPLTAGFRRTGLRAKYEIGCRHQLYDHNCGVNRDDPQFRTDAEVAAVSGLVVTFTEGSVPGAESLVSGELVWGSQRRLIVAASNEAGSVTLQAQLPGLVPGAVVALHPGCNHQTNHCANRFDNLVRFGGFPRLPKENPFEEDFA